MNADHDHLPDNSKFDAAIRARHQAALASLSPRAQAQLAQRRNAALRGAGVRRGHGFRYAAAGFAVLGALALGLQLRAPSGPTVAPAGIASTSASTTTATMLDEDPEFYAWLASADAQLVAME